MHVVSFLALILLFAPLALSAQDEKSLVIPGGDAPEAAAPAAGGSAGPGETSAPGAPAAPAAPAAGPLVSSWDFIRMLLILAAVIGVIYALFFFLKRGFRRQLPQNELIRLLGNRSLAGNRALHLVALGRSVYLVGSAESGINLIAEVKDPETLDQIRLESSAAGKPPPSFSQFFQSLWKPGGRRPGRGDGLRFMKQQRQRLEKM